MLPSGQWSAAGTKRLLESSTYHYLSKVTSSRRDETTHKLKDSSHAGFFTTQCRGLMPRTTVAEFRDPDRYTPDETSPTDPDRYTPDETSARVPDLPLLVQVPSSRRDETTHVLSTISLTAISRKWLPAWVDVQWSPAGPDGSLLPRCPLIAWNIPIQEYTGSQQAVLLMKQLTDILPWGDHPRKVKVLLYGGLERSFSDSPVVVELEGSTSVTAAPWIPGGIEHVIT